MRAMGMTFGKSPEPSYFAFFESHKRYNITRFQRAYTWKDYQIKGIIADLDHIRKTGQQVGWPSILIQKSPTKNNTPNVISYDLGDGQQRVISVSLGLIALWQSAYSKKSMGEISSEEFEYFREIIPEIGFKKSAEGILAKSVATDYGLILDPTIAFYSKAANETFKSLFTPLQAPFWQSIKAKIASSSDGSGLLKAFQIYYEEFKKYDPQQLKDAAENLLTKVTLSVLEYESDEDMQRAFANMNSFGISLTESELVKAKFYGHFKLKDPALAEDLASFWTNELESKDWKSLKSNTPGWGLPKARKPPLELFLEEFLCLYDGWDIAIKRPKHDDNPRSSNEHWLRDSWGEHLEKVADISKFWDQFKKSVELFKIANSVEAFTPGTLQWEVNYTYQILDKVIHFPSIMMKLSLSMNDQDFKKSLILLQKYYMYLNFVTEESRNLNQSIIKSNSPILKWELTYQEFKNYLESTSAAKLQWRSKKFIQSVLSVASYENKMNPQICELFIYAINEQKRARKEYGGLFNTKTEIEGASRSREHILPQTPRETLSPEEQDFYDRKIGQLGNSFVLSKNLNSSASNKSVKDKIETYEDSTLSPWGVYWVEDFLKDYEEAGKWGFDEIDARSKKLAEVFSNHLSPEVPYSEFRGLLETCKIGDKFETHDSVNPYCLTLTADGLLEDSKGMQFGSYIDIRSSRNDLSEMKSLVLYKTDESEKLYAKITLILNKAAQFEIVKQPSTLFEEGEAIVKTNNRTGPRTEVSVSSNGFNMTSTKMSGIYKDFMKTYWVDNKEVMTDLFRGGTGIVKTDLIAEEKKELYSELDSEYSIYSNKSRPSLAQDIELLCKALDETCTITGLRDYSTQ